MAHHWRGGRRSGPVGSGRDISRPDAAVRDRGEEHNAPVVFAGIVKFVGPGHRPKGASAQLRVEIVEGRGHLAPGRL